MGQIKTNDHILIDIMGIYLQDISILYGWITFHITVSELVKKIKLIERVNNI